MDTKGSIGLEIRTGRPGISAENCGLWVRPVRKKARLDDFSLNEFIDK